MIGDLVGGRSSASMMLRTKNTTAEEQPKFKILKLSVARRSSLVNHSLLEGDPGTTCLSLEEEEETSNLVGIVANCRTGRRRLVAWTGANKVNLKYDFHSAIIALAK